jgi:hypothetical protein
MSEEITNWGKKLHQDLCFPLFDKAAILFAKQIIDKVMRAFLVAGCPSLPIGDDLYRILQSTGRVESRVATVVVPEIDGFFDVGINVPPAGVCYQQTRKTAQPPFREADRLNVV